MPDPVLIQPQPDKKSGAMSLLLKVLGGLALLCVGAVFLCALSFYFMVRPQDLPPSSARDWIDVEPADEVVHAYSGLRWLDSQRYFVLKADPGSFDARIKRLSATAGTPPTREVRVSEGAGKELWYPSEKLPAWWDVEKLESVIVVDVSYKGANHSGSLSYFSKERGLIYVVDR